MFNRVGSPLFPVARQFVTAVEITS